MNLVSSRVGAGACAAVAAIALVSVAAWRVNGAPNQAAASRDGRPDLSGIWQAVNSANWDIQTHAARAGVPQLGTLLAAPAGFGVVEGNEIPYQPWAAAKKKENFEKRWTADPEAKCYLPGVPRATYMPFPFQIIQGTDKIMISYEYAGAARIIHMDKVADSPVDTWMGHSRGRWEGNTLVVDVTSFNDQSWFDRAGNFHSDALHVIERYTPRGADALNYEATIEDEKVFTRPWKVSMPLYRRLEKNAQLLEFKCVEFSEELLYGHLRKKSTK
jgi:hypothetical protein